MRMIKLISAIVVMTLGHGCGYHIGSLAHPQIKTIAIAPVVNETLFPYVAAEMRDMLCEVFGVDGSFRVKDAKVADCVVNCRVTNIRITAINKVSEDRDKLYRPAEWQVVLEAEFVVIIPGRKEPLVAKRNISGTSQYQAFGDYNTMQRNGIRQAAFDAAERIVEYTTEGW